MTARPKVSTCLWFDRDGEEAAEFYVSLLPHSRITHVSRYGEAGPMPAGTAMTVSFELAGTPFMALNGGPHFEATEACSLVVSCDSQEEIDRLWSSLVADGGRESQCFWLKDRFGVSWQIVPSGMGEWMTAADPLAAARVMSAVMSSVKADIATLQAAYEGKI